ncbi:FUSC family protein [Lampropedia aestuarii]|uniref:FUSC family protein n=1 Tax=Lampropedia aestuarii TaxID=2562762 RepID=UPI002468E4D3|nr:FUSC family protein [Lampropedia aestuarii]MDH5856759.1 FUSC family protein [Lampropedia aestuarii]
MSPSVLRTFFPVALDELMPFDGRLASAIRVASVCALTTMLFMVYGIPLVAIGCYLVIFVMKPNISGSMLMAIGIIVLASLIIWLMLWAVQMTIDRPVLRMAMLAFFSFLFLYLGVASKVGEAGSILALVMAFVISMIGQIPLGEIATRAVLYAWLMAVVPMGVLLAFTLTFAPSPGKILRNNLAQRMQRIAEQLDLEANPAAWLAPLRQGNADIAITMLFVKVFAVLPRAEIARLQQTVNASYMVAAAAQVAQRNGIQTAAHPALAAYCRALSEAIQNGQPFPAPPAQLQSPLPAEAQALEPLQQHLLCFPAQPVLAFHEQVVQPKEGFLNPDVKTNRLYSQYALKATFCAIACYVVYTALQWQDIHTALITCYVVALSTTGETVHKLSLRILGCLIGASFGLLSIFFVIPYIHSIGALMLLVFAVTLVAGWVASGSERSAYAGVQIGLAFLLTVLQGFGPEVTLDAAMDRIAGILLGNCMMYIVFTRVWPVSAGQAAAEQLNALAAKFKLLLDQPVATAQTSNDLQRLLPKLQAVRDQLMMNDYEPLSMRRSDEDMAAMQQAADQLENLYLQTAFATQGSISESKKQGAAQLSHQLAILAQPSS